MRPLSLAAAVLALAGPLAASAQGQVQDEGVEAWAPLPEQVDLSAVPDVPPPPALPGEPESPALSAFRLRVRALAAGLPPPPMVVELYRPGMALVPRPAAQLSTPGPAAARPPPPPPVTSDLTLLGGRVLPPWTFALAGWLGLPTLGARLQLGLGSGWDVGAGYGGVYGQSHELSFFGRRALGEGEVEWAVSVEGSAVFFAQRPALDGSGARGLAGRRNFNLAPGLHLSRRSAGSNWRWLGHVQGVLSLDTEPTSVLPLGGVPPPVVLGWNLPVLVGAEWPLSQQVVVQVLGGFELHGRSGDVPFMPVLRAGLLFGN
jgi:hypothetical protein